MKDFLNVGKPTLSFEIFPPKGKGDLGSVFSTIDALASLSPDLISVTYGAGGTSRENTVEIASAVQNSYGIPALAHLTCAGCSEPEMRKILEELKQKGVKNLLTLRGDMAEGETLTDFQYASDLIRFIKKNYDFNIFAACYPEKHPEARSMEEDVSRLKEKAEYGADVLISQLFFDNSVFYSFRDMARKRGITARIVAGIMPVTSAAQINKMVTLCGASMPDDVRQIVRAYGHNAMAMKEAGIAHATKQIVDLLANGVDGIHLYTMNLPDVAKRISENIRGILFALRVKRD